MLLRVFICSSPCSPARSFKAGLQWPGQGCGSGPRPCPAPDNGRTGRELSEWHTAALPHSQPAAGAGPGFLIPNFHHLSNGKAPELIKSQLGESNMNDFMRFCKKKTKPKDMNAFQGQHDKPFAKKKWRRSHYTCLGIILPLQDLNRNIHAVF